jgi:hypothetical protein
LQCAEMPTEDDALCLPAPFVAPLAAALASLGHWDHLRTIVVEAVQSLPESGGLQHVGVQSWEGMARVILLFHAEPVAMFFRERLSIVSHDLAVRFCDVCEPHAHMWAQAADFVRATRAVPAPPMAPGPTMPPAQPAASGLTQADIASLQATIKTLQKETAAATVVARDAQRASTAASMSGALRSSMAEAGSFDTGAWRRMDVWSAHWGAPNVGDLLREAETVHAAVEGVSDVHRLLFKVLTDAVRASIRIARRGGLPPESAFEQIVAPSVVDLVSYLRVAQFYSARSKDLDPAFLTEAYADLRVTELSRDEVERVLKARAKAHPRITSRWTAGGRPGRSVSRAGRPTDSSRPPGRGSSRGSRSSRSNSAGSRSGSRPARTPRPSGA